MNTTMFKLTTTTGRVEKVLAEYPFTRDSDIELFGKVCELFYPPMERSIHNYRDFTAVLRQLPDMNQISRSRRKVITKHKYKKYLPNSWFVAQARKINQEVYEEYARLNLSDNKLEGSIL